MRHLYACNAGPLEFCQYPYTPKRGLPYGMEPQTVTLMDDGTLRLYVYQTLVKTIEVSFLLEEDEIRHVVLLSDGVGNWDAVVRELPEGRYIMQWYFDGICKINCRAPLCYHRGKICNFAEIPEKNNDDFLLKEVPHGTVRQEYLFSDVYGVYANCWIYTPPSYEKEKERQYPVLYLLSGTQGNETTWIWNMKADLLLDNLVHENKCQEMIMVCTAAGKYEDCEEDASTEAFICKDVIPFVEAHFRVIPDGRNRAVAGLEEGSLLAQEIYLHNQRCFSGIGVFGGTLQKKVYENGHKAVLCFCTEEKNVQMWRGAVSDMIQALFRKEEKGE